MFRACLNAAVLSIALASPAAAETVGEVGVDWMGNDNIVFAQQNADGTVTFIVL